MSANMLPHVVLKSYPVAARMHPTIGHARDILKRDMERARRAAAGLHPQGPLVARKGIRRGAQGQPQSAQPSDATHSIDVTNATVTYDMAVDIGETAQTFNLLIDTGSSNTWIGAATKYKPSSSSKDTRKTFQVSYGSGMASGEEFLETCKLGDELVIEQQSIGVAKRTQGFNDGIDGILGIGPVDLTSGTVKGTPSVPTVTDNLRSQGTIQVETIGCYYAPTEDDSDLGKGELTFGSSDPSKFTGTMTYVPITETSPASEYWGVDQEIQYGSDTIMSQSAGIVDTGTTLVLLPSDAFDSYQKATGATMDSETGLLSVTEEQYDNMQSLNFKIGDTTLEMTNNAQIWPRSMNSMLGGDADKIYLVCADIGSVGGQGLDFINGFAFLQRFYTEYDTTNARIGFASTAHTMDETN